MKRFSPRHLIVGIAFLALCAFTIGTVGGAFGQSKTAPKAASTDVYHDLEIFTKACEKLSTLMAEEDRRIEEATRAESKRAEEMEHLALAKNAAEEEIKMRVQAHKLTLTIVDFLAQRRLI